MSSASAHATPGAAAQGHETPHVHTQMIHKTPADVARDVIGHQPDA